MMKPHSKTLTLKEIETQIGSLSKPSKMPCHGYSLPATQCKRGAILRQIKNSVCSGCYALKNRYMFNNVQTALHKRLDALEADIDTWQRLLTELINRKEKSGYFRWHDSGDIQSPEHLSAINNIAFALPHIKFWIPTREFGLVKEWAKTNEIAPNLAIRISANMIGQNLSRPSIGSTKLTTSSVGAAQTLSDNRNCPAPQQDNECKDCRSCWDTKVSNINYTLH
jgi:hypothetical protein